MSSFEIGQTDFMLNGRPFQVISGAMHYFRVHPDQWADRIEKARQLGLNTIDTYVAWNFHSSRPDEFRLDGWRDLGRFLDLVAEAGLSAIVRPGPYICAEWTNAGLANWLTAKPGIRLRTSDPAYLAAVASFYRSVLPVVADRQVTRGGNVLMVQVENEYGAFGEDEEYLRSLVQLIRDEGIEVPLFTCDQANDEMLRRGGLPELLRTGTFGSRSLEHLEALRRHQPTGPLMCAEFWNGWFDSWGQHHHVTDPSRSAEDLDALLASGASVNLYMFHGGTNFGLTNGANDRGTFAPIVTSYDCDAPLREDGSPGPKFHAFREVISRYAPVPEACPAEFVPAPSFTVQFRSSGATGIMGAQGRRFDHLPTLDEVDPNATFAVYETRVAADDEVVVLGEVRDQARFSFDGSAFGVLSRQQHERAITLPKPGWGILQVLVEDLGRVNYDSRIGEPKGLIAPAVTARRELTDWRVSVLDLDAIPDIAATASEPVDPATPRPGPVILTASFDAEPGVDLFLDTSGWGHGLVWINGFLLGRYWSAGPTRTLYIPGSLVLPESNSLAVWELAACPRPEARFVSNPELGHTEA